MPANLRLLLISLIACSSVFVLFVALLIMDPQTAVEPLSNSRYGKTAMMGRFAFLLLSLIGVIYGAIAFMVEEKSTFLVAALATVLIIFISLTPTLDGGHMFAANGLMLLLFGYYSFRLVIAQSVWLLVHIAFPFLIILTLISLAQFNFGMVQKVTILYLAATVLIDSLLLCGISIGAADWLNWRGQKKKTVKVRIPSPRVIYRKNSRWEKFLEGSST